MYSTYGGSCFELQEPVFFSVAHGAFRSETNYIMFIKPNLNSYG